MGSLGLSWAVQISSFGLRIQACAVSCEYKRLNKRLARTRSSQPGMTGASIKISITYDEGLATMSCWYEDFY